MPNPRKPWSRPALNRHLLSLLDRPSTTLTSGSLRKEVAARVEFDPNYPPAYVRVQVDANNTPVARFVIHELLHVVMSEKVLGLDETLEEVLIVALEAHLWAFVEKSKSRRTKWDSLIERKLAEHCATLTDRTIEEIVDRTEG